MRRPTLLLTILCALVISLTGATPAVAAGQHHGHHHANRGATASTTTTTTSSASAGAASGSKQKLGDAVLNDCQSHGQLTKTWSKTDLRDALDVMSAATKQYSNCAQVIQNALLGKTTIKSGKGGDDSSGGSSSTTLIIVIVVVVIVLLLGLTLVIRRRRSSDGPGPGTAPPPASQ